MSSTRGRGGFVTGKNKNRRFGYYWCRKADCRSVMVRKEHLEATFVAHLRRLRADEQTISEFLKVAAQVWTQRQGDAEATARTLDARLVQQKRLKSELLLAKLRGEVNQNDYAQANSEFDQEIEAIEGRLNSEQSGGATLAAFLRFADAMMLDVAGAWRSAEPDQRIRLQNLLFQNGLNYSDQSHDFGHIKPSLFSVMQEMVAVGDGKKVGVQTFRQKQDLQASEKNKKFEHPNSSLLNSMDENTGKDWWLASQTFQSLNQAPVTVSKMERLCAEIAEITNKGRGSSHFLIARTAGTGQNPPSKGRSRAASIHHFLDP